LLWILHRGEAAFELPRKAAETASTVH
jgi:hypothetical protein